MNTTNIPLMAWGSKEISGYVSGGLQQGMASEAVGPDGSIFQQLMAQMKGMKIQTTQNLQTSPLNQANSDATGEELNLLGLLFSGKNSGELENSNNEVQQEAVEESSGLELLQALMSGLPYASSMQQNSEPMKNANALNSETAVPVEMLNVNSAVGDLTNGAFTGNVTQGQQFSSVEAFAQSMQTVDSSNQNTAVNTLGETLENLELIGSGLEKKNGAELSSRTNDNAQDELTNIQALSRESETVESYQRSRSSNLVENGRETATDEAGNSNQKQAQFASDELNRNGFNTDTQEYLNTAQYTDAVKESGSMNQTVQSAEKTEQYSQISTEILSRLEQKNTSEFRMQLHPEDLGQIDVKLKLHDGKLIIDILAASAKTQELLTSQVDKLIASIGLQNVQVESVQVGQQMNQQGGNGQNQWQSMNFEMDFSQRRNQEQLQKELYDSLNQTGSGGASQMEVQELSGNTIQSLGQYHLHRLNYMV